MALKTDRYELQTDISFFCDTALDRGIVVHHAATVGSGAAMDQGVNLCVAVATPDGDDIPLGILLNDVVDKDLTRTHLNQHKDEVAKGGKVTVLRKGYVVTDKVVGTPTVGQWAICGAAGSIAGADDVLTMEGSGNLVIGKFLSVKDSDGYAKVEVNLP